MSLSASAPWLKYYGEVPHHLTYPQKTIYQMVRDAAIRDARLPAYEFMGKKTTFAQFMEKIDQTAQAFLAMGIQKGDLFFQPVGCAVVVRILLGQQLPAGQVDRPVARGGGPEVPFVPVKADAFVVEGGDHLPRPVGRAVVHENQFEIAESLSQQAFDAVSDPLFRVVNGYDDADFGYIHVK